jgi:hypothetical protein
MKFFKSFIDWSNLLFVFPLFLAVFFRVYPYAFIISCAVLCSLIHHVWHNEKFRFVDRLFAILLMACNTLFCWLGKFAFPYFYLAFFFVVCALYFYFKKSGDEKSYEIHHGLWHGFSALTTIFCLLTYLYGSGVI